MEEETKQNETCMIVVKKDEIKGLTDLGFEEDDDLMIYETPSGIIGVDKNTGIVAVDTKDGSSVEEMAIVSELVANGIADVVTADELAATQTEEMVNNAENVNRDDE